MSKPALIISLLLGCFSVVSQPRLAGRIIDENGEAFAGVRILEEGTSNVTVSDLKGYFILHLQDTGSVVVSFIEYFDQVILVQSDSTIEVTMLPDSLTEFLPYTPLYANFYVTKTGINYGALNNNPGIESQNVIYSLWRVNLKLMSDVKWRFIGDETYFNLRVRRFHIYNKNSFSVGLRSEYKSVVDSNNNIKFYSISSDFSFMEYIISTGYAKRINTLTESTNSDRGINLEFQKYLLNLLAFRVGGIYWWDDWQFNINLTSQIPRTRLSIGVGWEQIENWNQLDLSILYKWNF